MKVPYTKSGKSGSTVWQRARYGQICYPAFVPFNPRTPEQMAVRRAFRDVSARWRTLTQEQRDVWIAVAWTQWSKPRLFQRGRLTGCQLFIKTNVPLANQGKPQIDLPAEYVRSTKRAVSSRGVASEGRSKKEGCRKMAPKAVSGLHARVFVSKRNTGRRRTSLRYRACTVVPPYHHRSNTLPGRCAHFGPQNRLRFPCRSQPPRCRGAPAPI
jgi:hypothetical protein